MAANKLKITWVRSGIQAKDRHERTVRALGLRKLHQSVEHNDTPVIRGMIHSIGYMVQVEEVQGS